MKKGQLIEGIVEKVEFPNKGILSIEDKKVIVKFALPGQKVTAVINKLRKGKAEARLVEVLEQSPIEIKSQCIHFGICGGCLYQNLSYENQLRLKEQQVKEILDQAMEGKSYEFQGIKGSPEAYGYRNKMEFSFGDAYKDGPLSLGMHKRGGFYDIISVPHCQIVDEDYRQILTCVLEYFTERNTPFYHKMRHQGYLRHLLVRKGRKTGEILIALVTTTEEKEELQPLTDRLLLLQDRLKGTITGILHTLNDSLADIVQSDETRILYGRDYFYEELMGLHFKISQFSFFQTNSLGAEVLYETAREYIGQVEDKGKKEKVIYDLYSGTGTIAQMMAPVVKKVVGVEIIEEAVLAARENAKQNGLTNCEFIAGDVLKVLDDIAEKPDMIILDPPRDGIHPKALRKIIDYQVPRIVYISCKPTSLARDLEVFSANGYVMEKAVAVDMFPWTGNVETCVLLSKLKSAKSIEVKIELDEMDLTTAESKATYDEIKQYVFEHTGMKVSQLYVAQVKRKHGLIERINYNVGDGKSKVPQVPAEKEKAIEDALRCFKMI